jgi:hypothetical protein
MNVTILRLAPLALALLAASASAAVTPLQGRTLDGLAVAADDPAAVFEYDAVLDLTWLRDANVNGRMTWQDASAWADGLALGGYADWRLPSALAPCTGTACRGEMGVLWFDVLGNGIHHVPSQNPVNPGPFQNLQLWAYWLAEPVLTNPGHAYSFYTGLTVPGLQSGDLYSQTLYAMAVREGDVLGAVPEPATLASMLAGLGLVAGWLALRRRS